jgi:hypothetical protein
MVAIVHGMAIKYICEANSGIYHMPCVVHTGSLNLPVLLEYHELSFGESYQSNKVPISIGYDLPGRIEWRMTL